MIANDFAAAAFGAVDAMDVERFATHLTDDCVFIFGNAEPVVGKAAIAAYVDGFFSMLAGLRHDLLDVWQVADVIINRIQVTYTRRDGHRMSFPCAVIWRMRDGRIADYRIFIDNTPLFAS